MNCLKTDLKVAAFNSESDDEFIVWRYFNRDSWYSFTDICGPLLFDIRDGLNLRYCSSLIKKDQIQCIYFETGA
jgi:hypothetical protein